MTSALCDNANHPSGAWHETTPLPFAWQWGKRIHQRLNRERWGCRCSRGSGGEEDGAAAHVGLVSKPVTDEGQQVLGTCSPELRDILTGYRATVEQAWSPATSHPGMQGGVFWSYGQCGVTSAWLQRRLLTDHDTVTLYREGTVYYGNHWTSAHHCWLSDVTGRVFDLTADQFGAPVMAYLPASALLADQVTDPDLLARLAILTEAVDAA